MNKLLITLLATLSLGANAESIDCMNARYTSQQFCSSRDTNCLLEKSVAIQMLQICMQQKSIDRMNEQRQKSPTDFSNDLMNIINGSVINPVKVYR